MDISSKKLREDSIDRCLRVLEVGKTDPVQFVNAIKLVKCHNECFGLSPILNKTINNILCEFN